MNKMNLKGANKRYPPTVKKTPRSQKKQKKTNQKREGYRETHFPVHEVLLVRPAMWRYHQMK